MVLWVALVMLWCAFASAAIGFITARHEWLLLGCGSFIAGALALIAGLVAS